MGLSNRIRYAYCCNRCRMCMVLEYNPVSIQDRSGGSILVRSYGNTMDQQFPLTTRELLRCLYDQSEVNSD